MDAVLIYIDDWLSSGRVADMDADEERGYFRLIMHAAKQPGCGLVFDEKLLAARSLLKSQWGKETKHEDYRFGITSGQKILGCFHVLKDGVLVNVIDGTQLVVNPKEIDISECRKGFIYNERLLKGYTKFKREHAQKKKAADARWGKNRSEPSGDSVNVPGGSEERKPDQSMRPECSRIEKSCGCIEKECGCNPTRVGLELELSTSTDKASDKETERGSGGNQKLFVVNGSTEWWKQLTLAAIKGGMSLDPSEDSEGCTKYWRYLSSTEKKAAIEGIVVRIECGQYSDPSYVPTLENYLRKERWKESLRPKVQPPPETSRGSVGKALLDAKREQAKAKTNGSARETSRAS